jgi:hypothetical protein
MPESENEQRLYELLEAKGAWLEELYRRARDLELYKWAQLPGFTHRCGGAVWVLTESTGLGYVCEKCEEAGYV